MSACDQDRAKQGYGRHVRSPERRAGDRDQAATIADLCDWRLVAIGNSKCRDSLFPGADCRLHRVAQTTTETDGDQEVVAVERTDSPVHIAGAANWRFRRHPQSGQAVGEMPAERGRKVDAHDEDPARAVDATRNAKNIFRVETGVQVVQVAHVHFHAVLDSIRQAPLLARGGLQNGVGGDPGYEVGPQICHKFRIFPVPERLDGADDGGCVDAIALRQFARGQKKGVVGVLQDGANQFLAAGIEARLYVAEACLQRGATRRVFGFAVDGVVVIRHLLQPATGMRGTKVQHVLHKCNIFH